MWGWRGKCVELGRGLIRCCACADAGKMGKEGGAGNKFRTTLALPVHPYPSH